MSTSAVRGSLPTLATEVLDVAVGDVVNGAACALYKDLSVACWGSNHQGHLARVRCNRCGEKIESNFTFLRKFN